MSSRPSRWRGVLRTPLGASGTALISVVLLLAVFAPVLWSARASAVDTGGILQGSSSAHWLGTDDLGRDIFFRVLVATRLSVELALASTLIGVLVGVVLGTAPLLVGARAGRLVTAAVNIAVAFPGLLLALFLAVIFGAGAEGAVLAIGFATAPGLARLTQTLTDKIVAQDFIAAARIAGVGRIRLLTRHVLPNIGEPLVVNATISAGSALLAFAGLSFLGLGVRAPDYDWGRLLGDGLNGIYVHPAAALAPGVAIVLAGLAFNLFGEAIARALASPASAPRLSRGRPGSSPSPESTSAVPATAAAGDQPLLVVENLRVDVPGPDGPITPVRGVGFAVRRGEAVGIVGESGSGKSLTALAIAQLIEEPGRVAADRLEFLGDALLAGSAREKRHLLGTSLAMVFQDPMTSFNPAMRVGRQLAEVAEQHLGMGRRKALARAVDRLRSVHIPAAERRARQFPHEFSGGMRQRAMIGMGVMGTPALIIADEPTTALDMTVQRQVLRLLASVRDADDVAILLISHDVTVVESLCERVLVMYAGKVVEELHSTELRTRARHPYTRALVAAVPDMGTDRDQPLAVIPGRSADPGRPVPGCAFAARCALADDRCTGAEPPLVADGHGRRVACWHADDIAARPAERAPAGGRGVTGRE